MSERFLVGETLVYRNSINWWIVASDSMSVSKVVLWRGISVDDAILVAERQERFAGRINPKIGPAPSLERATS